MDNKIILLEDEIIIAFDLQELLIKAGYDTLVFHDSETAIKVLKEFKPQLAICDINLGKGETGIQFAKEALKILPQIEVIYVTAFSNQETINDAQLTVPFNYIVKPWNEEQIKVTVGFAFTYIKEKIKHNSLLKNLSHTEYKVLDLIGKQKKSKEIADILFIAEKTVRNHRYNIIKKLNITNDNNSLLKWAIINFKKYTN